MFFLYRLLWWMRHFQTEVPTRKIPLKMYKRPLKVINCQDWKCPNRMGNYLILFFWFQSLMWLLPGRPSQWSLSSKLYLIDLGYLPNRHVVETKAATFPLIWARIWWIRFHPLYRSWVFICVLPCKEKLLCGFRCAANSNRLSRSYLSWVSNFALPYWSMM